MPPVTVAVRIGTNMTACVELPTKLAIHAVT
jgi:hypothetical protein